jgi:hypothetical protein
MPHPPQIPLTPQTDERNFPRWAADAPPGKSGHPYPKMLTRPCTKEDRVEWREKNRRVDQHTRQEYYEGVAPVLHSPIPVLATIEMVDEGLAPLANEPVIVKDAAEEQRILEFLGLSEPYLPPTPVAIPVRTADTPSYRRSGIKVVHSPEWIDEPSVKRKGRPPGSKNKKPVTDVSN